MVFAGMFAERVAPYDPLEIDFAAMLAPPSGDHWLGTDTFGRDMLSRIIYGARTALVIGFTSSFIGSTLGAVSAPRRPISAAGSTTGSSVSSKSCWSSRSSCWRSSWWPCCVSRCCRIDLNLIFAIAIPIIPSVARVVRAAALAIREMPYIDAARAAGYSNSRIIMRHMAPNMVAPYLILFTAYIAQAILLEASLSFLGLGVTEPTRPGA